MWKKNGRKESIASKIQVEQSGKLIIIDVQLMPFYNISHFIWLNVTSFYTGENKKAIL